MSLKWPPKDPDEVLDYSVDWSRYLTGEEIINDVAWYMDVDGTKTEWTPSNTLNGMQLIAATNTDKVATVYLGMGQPNSVYKIYCRIETSTALVTERLVRIKIRDYY